MADITEAERALLDVAKELEPRDIRSTTAREKSYAEVWRRVQIEKLDREFPEWRQEFETRYRRYQEALDAFVQVERLAELADETWCNNTKRLIASEMRG